MSPDKQQGEVASSRFLDPTPGGRMPPLLEGTPHVYFDPYADIRHTENRLPHWQQDQATYFITFHLGDSVPKQLRERWQDERDAWLKRHPPPHTPEQTHEYHRRFTGEMERWLDAGHGSCILRRPECAAIVASALRHFDGQRYKQFAWVVMPNHVHALFALGALRTLENILHSWKSFTAHRINETLGRAGGLWHRAYFDRIVRDEQHFTNCLRYIRHNPEKSRLKMGEYVAFENESVRSDE